MVSTLRHLRVCCELKSLSSLAMNTFLKQLRSWSHFYLYRLRRLGLWKLEGDRCLSHCPKMLPFDRIERINYLKENMMSMYQSAVASVMPGVLVRKAIQQCDVNNYVINGVKYNFKQNLYVVGMGKAVLQMALDIQKIMGKHVVKGIISVPQGMENTPEAEVLIRNNIQVCGGAIGNLPDEAAESTALAIENMVQSLRVGSVLIVLISGGGSALLPAPVPGITVNDKAHLIYLLQSKGASIQEINSVRIRLSRLKGGQLALKAFPAHVVSFILSDIIGDPLDLIASGPTVQNNDSTTLPLNIVQKYGIQNEISQNILNALTIAKKDRPHYGAWKNVNNVLVGSNITALEAAKQIASENNFFPVILSDKISLSVTELSEWYCSFCMLFCDSLRKGNNEELNKFLLISVEKYNFNGDFIESTLLYSSQLKSSKAFCIIGGGEPTVTIKKHNSNKGGRSQELALRFSHLMDKSHKRRKSDFVCVLMAVGTDGIDGPTDAAGAFGYSDQINSAKEIKLDPETFINESNSYGYFTALNQDLIKVGHTGTNVMDLHVLAIQACASC